MSAQTLTEFGRLKLLRLRLNGSASYRPYDICRTPEGLERDRINNNPKPPETAHV